MPQSMVMRALSLMPKRGNAHLDSTLFSNEIIESRNSSFSERSFSRLPAMAAVDLASVIARFAKFFGRLFFLC